MLSTGLGCGSGSVAPGLLRTADLPPARARLEPLKAIALTGALRVRSFRRVWLLVQ
jgi:hypothetical protein